MNEAFSVGEAVAGAPLARVGSGARFPWASLAALGTLVAAAVLANAWFTGSTHHLYVEQGQSGAAGSARQRFVVSGGRIQPQIVASGDERLVFTWGRNDGVAEVRYGAVSTAPAAIEIAAVHHGTRRVLARHVLDANGGLARSVPIPDGVETVELSNHGAVTWMDARVVRQPRLWPPALGFAALAAAALALRGPSARSPRPLLIALTATIAVGGVASVLEAGLRVLSPSLPWLAAVRRDLGEVQPDPRWQDTPAYGRRLRAGLRTFCEWRQGDIVRMGFLAPELAPQGRLRFPLVTDADGFRNDDPPGPAPIVGLGDSFTDALTVPTERTWPARLQAQLGLRVRNYGTAGFGPLQELEVVRQFVLPRRPRVAVLAFFGGNDLIDAERFDGLRRGGPAPALPGWPIKDVVARFDELYTYSLLSGVARSLREQHLERVEERDVGDGVRADVFSLPPDAPAFDRGLFTLSVAGARLRFAFLPPYLNILRFSPQELKARPGWALTREAIREMNRLLRDRGGRLVVMFVPSKSQVYLPLVASALSPAERQAAMRFLVPDNPPDFDVLYRRRRAMGGLVGELCAKEEIPFLDLTAPLETVVDGGHNAYFPDDSHWNAAGHDAAARELSAFLRDRGLVSP